MCCVKWNERDRVSDACREERSARPDVDRVEASKLARQRVLGADQKQLVGVGVLRSEAMLAGQNAPPQRDPTDRDRTALPQRRQLLVGVPVVLPNPRVTAEQVLGELSGPEGVDSAFVALDGRRDAVRRALGLE